MSGRFMRKQKKIEGSGKVPEAAVTDPSGLEGPEELPELEGSSAPMEATPEEMAPSAPIPTPQGSSKDALGALLRGSQVRLGSPAPGEPFSAWRLKTLSQVRGLMEKLAQNPQSPIGVQASPSVLKLLQGWISAGTPDDFQIASEVFLKADPQKPLWRLAPDGTGRWRLSGFNPDQSPQLPIGSLYLVLRPESNPQAAQALKLRAEIVGNVRRGDLNRARASIQKASSMLSEEDIEDAGDEGLPGPDEAQDLPSRDLLQAFSIASPRKRESLLGAVQSRFSPEVLASLPPEAQEKISQYLASLA